MRSLWVFLLLLSSFSLLQAQSKPKTPAGKQEKTEKVKKKEKIKKVKKEKGERKKIPFHLDLGLNTPLLFGKLVATDSPQQTNPNPYLLMGKLLVGKLAIRAGVGGHLDKAIEREGEFADSRTTENKGIEARFGVEYQHRFSAKWAGTFGADGILFAHKEQVIIDSGFDVVSTGTVDTGWGIGPVLGLQFNITRRLSILTEGAFYYTQSDAQTSRLFKNFPEFDDELGSIEKTALRINLPTTFFIVYQF